MERKHIQHFAKIFLEINDCVDTIRLQTFIADRPEVDAWIDALEISEALESMAFAMEIEVASGKGFDRVYAYKDVLKKTYEKVNTIAIDVDEVVAELIDRWLDKYNEKYNDTLVKSSVTDWRIQDFVKPECGDKIFDFLKDDDLLDDVKPVVGAREAVEALRKAGKRVVFVTAGMHPYKLKWLKDNGFISDDRDFVFAKDKALISTSILVDDAFHNVRDFPGVGILLNKPWNIDFHWKNRASNWDEILKFILG